MVHLLLIETKDQKDTLLAHREAKVTKAWVLFPKVGYQTSLMTLPLL
jgi:hypothetical protein